MSGCHDTTLAAVLASLGAFDGEKWPPYTSHIALELFRQSNQQELIPENQRQEALVASPDTSHTRKGWFAGLFGGNSADRVSSDNVSGMARRKVEQLSSSERSKLEGYFVRVRYNDKVTNFPGCKPAGKHLEGDESFCTLVSHRIVNSYILAI